MEDESNNSEMETAFSNDDVLAKLEAYTDMPEASENSEQADEHVEENASEETDVETPDEAEQFFEINGEQVALSELQSGYLRQADYTKKTQTLAEERKAYQLEQFDKNQVRSHAIELIEQAKVELAAILSVNPEPDWETLLREDPHSYMLAQVEWQKREQAVRAFRDQHAQMIADKEAFEAQQHQQELEASQAYLKDKYPELRDRSTATQALGEMSELLGSYGFNQQDVNGLSDHRVISLIYDFQKLLKTQKAIPQVVQKMEQKPVISQKQNSSKTSDAYTRDFNKFNKSRNGNDAIALISRLL